MGYAADSGAVPLRRDKLSNLKEWLLGVSCIAFGLAVLLIHYTLSTRDHTLRSVDEIAPSIYRDVTPREAETQEPIVINNTWINSYTDDPETIRYFDSRSALDNQGVTTPSLNQGQAELFPSVQGASIILEFVPRARQFTPEVSLEFYDKVIKPGNLWSAEEYHAGLENMRFYDQAGHRINYADNQRNAGLEVGDGQYRYFWQSE